MRKTWLFYWRPWRLFVGRLATSKRLPQWFTDPLLNYLYPDDLEVSFSDGGEQ